MRWGCRSSVRKTPQLVTRVTVDTRAQETLSTTLRNAGTSCIMRGSRDVPAKKLMFWDFPGRYA